MNNTSYYSRIFSVTMALAFGLAGAAFGQLQWSSYDTSGNLVTANVATGGDLASATSVTFTIPANTQLFFVTKNFTPIVLSQATASAVVTFKFSASAGLTGVAQRTVEWGLYNSAGTASLADDIGMYGGWREPTLKAYFTPADRQICLQALVRVLANPPPEHQPTAQPIPTRFDCI